MDCMKSSNSMKEFEVETELPPPSSGRLWVAYMCVFTDAVCFTYIFAFLPYYVESLLEPQLAGLEKHQRDAEVAYHSGILGTSYSVGQVISAFAMGMLSDKVGRRPVLIAGTLATVLITGVFGFLPNFYAAVIVRFLVLVTQNGLCNAVIVAARAMLSDYTADSERVAAFVRLNKYGLVGIVLGPCIGGGLSEPNKHLPAFFHSPLFDVFPFLLPCLSCFVLALFTFFLVVKYAQDRPRSTEPLIEREEAEKQSSFAILRGNPEFRIACISWSISAFTGSMYIELVGLWCKTDRSSGGLGWTQEARISVVFFTGSLGLFLFMAFGLRKMIARFGTGRVLRTGLALGAVAMSIVPRLSDLPSNLLWPFLLSANMLMSVSMGACVTSINIIINSVVPKELYGAANGLGISIVALVRAFGPVSAGSLFGWAISEPRPFPLDRGLAFLTASTVNLCNIVLARNVK